MTISAGFLPIPLVLNYLDETVMTRLKGEEETVLKRRIVRLEDIPYISHLYLISKPLISHSLLDMGYLLLIFYQFLRLPGTLPLTG